MSLGFIKQSRRNFIELIDTLSIEQLNQVPENYNNNIIWNFAHIIVTQQLLCYKLSNLEMSLESEMIEAFRKGTRPERFYSKDELEEFKHLAISTLEDFEKDLEKGIFTEFKEYSTSYGVTLHNIEEAMRFNSLHESLHLGYAMALRKLVNN